MILYKTPSWVSVSGGICLVGFTKKVLALLEDYKTQSSAGKIAILIHLRTIFQHATIQEGIDAIDSIQNRKDLNVLLGVGMKGVWYYALAKRKGEMMGL